MTDQTRHPGGRPSKYDPAFCERVIEYGAQGMGPAEIAFNLGIARSTFILWTEEHPEFLTAANMAATAAQAWFERAGREGLHADKFNGAVWKKTMEARFRDDYTERTETKTTVEASDPLTAVLSAIADRGKKIHDRD